MGASGHGAGTDGVDIGAIIALIFVIGWSVGTIWGIVWSYRRFRNRIYDWAQAHGCAILSLSNGFGPITLLGIPFLSTWSFGMLWLGSWKANVQDSQGGQRHIRFHFPGKFLGRLMPFMDVPWGQMELVRS